MYVNRCSEKYRRGLSSCDACKVQFKLLMSKPQTPGAPQHVRPPAISGNAVRVADGCRTPRDDHDMSSGQHDW